MSTKQESVTVWWLLIGREGGSAVAIWFKSQRELATMTDALLRARRRCDCPLCPGDVLRPSKRSATVEEMRKVAIDQFAIKSVKVRHDPSLYCRDRSTSEDCDVSSAHV
jgi:hypothetical protein